MMASLAMLALLTLLLSTLFKLMWPWLDSMMVPAASISMSSPYLIAWRWVHPTFSKHAKAITCYGSEGLITFLND